MIALLVFLLVAGIIAWAIAIPLVALLAPRLLQSGTPGARAQRALLLAVLPWATTAVSIAAMLVLAAAKWSGWITDHCEHHGPGHPHLCFEHLPAIAPLPAWVLLMGALALLVWRVIGWWLERRSVRRRFGALLVLATGRGALRSLEHAHPIAFAAGVRQPRVLLSSGLSRSLTERERRIVVGHELAHLRRRDPFWADLLDLLLVLHLPRHAGQLLTGWRQAVEERADDDVARRFGNEGTAAALVRVARLMSAPRWQLSAAGCNPLARARRLLADAPAARTSLAFEILFAAALLGAAAGVVAAHHPIETLLGLL